MKTLNASGSSTTSHKNLTTRLTLTGWLLTSGLSKPWLIKHLHLWLLKERALKHSWELRVTPKPTDLWFQVVALLFNKTSINTLNERLTNYLLTFLFNSSQIISITNFSPFSVSTTPLKAIVNGPSGQNIWALVYATIGTCFSPSLMQSGKLLSSTYKGLFVILLDTNTCVPEYPT